MLFGNMKFPDGTRFKGVFISGADKQGHKGQCVGFMSSGWGLKGMLSSKMVQGEAAQFLCSRASQLHVVEGHATNSCTSASGQRERSLFQGRGDSDHSVIHNITNRHCLVVDGCHVLETFLSLALMSMSGQSQCGMSGVVECWPLFNL